MTRPRCKETCLPEHGVHAQNCPLHVDRTPPAEDVEARMMDLVEFHIQPRALRVRDVIRDAAFPWVFEEVTEIGAGRVLFASGRWEPAKHIWRMYRHGDNSPILPLHWGG